MGFGYLFIGYLFFFNIVFAPYTDFAAMALMLVGLSTLQKYAKGFKTAFIVGIPLAVCSFVSFLLAIAALAHIFTAPTFVGDTLSLVSLLFKAVYLWFLQTGVSQISKETAIPVLQARAVRNKVLTIPFYAIAVLVTLPIWTSLPTVSICLNIFYLLFALLYAFLNAKNFFEAYIWICLEGDETMERKSSRFGVVNKLYALSDRLDEKTLERKRGEQAEKLAKHCAKKGKKGKKQ